MGDVPILIWNQCVTFAGGERPFQRCGKMTGLRKRGTFQVNAGHNKDARSGPMGGLVPVGSMKKVEGSDGKVIGDRGVAGEGEDDQ